jgi:transposase
MPRGGDRGGRSPRYYLPAEPFRQATFIWLGLQAKEYNAWHERGAEGNTHAARPKWSRLSPVEYLEQHMDVSRAWFDKFLSGKSKKIPFDLADQLLMAMNTHWRRHPVFNEMYYSVDLAHLDKIKPLHNRRHSGGERNHVNYHQIAWHLKSGMTRAEAKEKFGASENQLDRIVAQYDISSHKSRPFEGRNNNRRSLDYEEAHRLREEEGLSHAEIASRFGVDTRSVTQALYRMRKREQVAA